MSLTKTIVLKEDRAFAVFGEDGSIREAEQGLYLCDTRFLSSYVWEWNTAFQGLLSHSPRPDAALFVGSLIQGPSQLVGLRRELRLEDTVLSEALTLENTSLERHRICGLLRVRADFKDLFETRGFAFLNRSIPPPRVEAARLSFSYKSQDGSDFAVSVYSDSGGLEASPEGFLLEADLAPGERRSWSLRVELRHPASGSGRAALPDYNEWEASFPRPWFQSTGTERHAVLRQAVRDLRALVFSTEDGPFPAAGIPWYVAPFGRDALLTSYMTLPFRPDLALGVLRFLGRHQGRRVDQTRAEEPGKILHEIRSGELARLDLIPHTPYYGTVDATPLYLILLDRYFECTGDAAAVRELLPFWQSALTWMSGWGDRDADGFIEYVGDEDGLGLGVQSWKDSMDSMSHADGTLAKGSIRPVEAQGYAYRAALAGARLYRAIGEPQSAVPWQLWAEALAQRFDKAFWVPELRGYAMALDGDRRPLAVKSSNAGQLLWTGLLSHDRAVAVAEVLAGPELQSGWGIRTLGTEEVRYNPLSYHNGSVWPHDTALIARGLYDYGFIDQARTLARALFDLAASQPDRRLPELVAGVPRDSSPPVPYPAACRPQAWDAAALIYIEPLL